MSERRPLTEGLKSPLPPVDPKLEEQFVFHNKTKLDAEPPAEKPSPSSSLSPITTRIRADFAASLKRASLERQLQGVTPNTMREILEEALEPWLKSHGYVS